MRKKRRMRRKRWIREGRDGWKDKRKKDEVGKRKKRWR